MDERLTEQARRVVELALAEARRHGHEDVSTTDLLVGLLLEQGVAASVLAQFGASEELVRERVEEVQGEREFSPWGGDEVRLTAPARRAMEGAFREAMWFGNWVAPEHILLALLVDEEGLAAHVFRCLALSPPGLRGVLVKGLERERGVQVPSSRRGARRGAVSDRAELLELLHDADDSWGSVCGRYRIWEHRARSRDAFAQLGNRPGTAMMRLVAPAAGPAESESEEQSEVVSLWWHRPDRVRVEHEGGRQNGAYAVQVGERWWRWHPELGATSNVDDPDLTSHIGEEVRPLVQPSALLGALRFTRVARSHNSRHAVFRAEALPREDPQHGLPAHLRLRLLGPGATRYRLEFDAASGLIRQSQAFFRNELFRTIDAVELEINALIDDALFEFTAPPGEETR